MPRARIHWAKDHGATRDKVTKAVVIISRRKDLSLEKFRDYWLSEHAQLASRLPGLVRYVQDHIGRLET